MKRLTLSLAVILISLQCFSQSDPKAQEILKGVSTKYKSYKSLVANFKLNLLDKKSNKSTNQSGIVTLKGNMYNLTMADQQVMSNGKLMWTFLKESNEVQISEAETKNDALSPTTIFTMYEKGFKTKFIGEKKIGGLDIQQIELYPEGNKKNYFKILISISKKDKYVTGAKIFDKNGNIYTYSIIKFTPNAVVSDDTFTFDPKKFPGVEVVDLR